MPERSRTSVSSPTSPAGIAALLRTRRQVEEERSIREAAEKRLSQVGMWESRDELARNIPYGRQRMLEIARALATSPRMLVLDELSSGLNPRETEDLMAFIMGNHPRRASHRVPHRARHE
ncbi:MAG: ATP-binding cassette domain-containing protein, partial [Spirochaetia bacterium]